MERKSLRGGSWFPLAVWWVFWGMAAPAGAGETIYAPAGQYQPSEDTVWPARTLVLGASFTGVADDASALFLNPAGLAGLDRAEINLTSDFGSLEAFRETALAGFNISPGNGFGVSATYLNFGTLSGRDDSGNPTNGYGADQFTGQAGWGTQVLKGLSLGVGLEYSMESLTGTPYQAWRPDLGILFDPFAEWKIGFDYTFSGWGTWPGPNISTVKVGASWEKTLSGEIRVLAALGGLFQSDQTDRLQGGVEVAYGSILFARAGYEFEPDGEAPAVFSLGAGFVVAGLTLDYAYLPYGDILGNTHRFSLGFPLSVPVALPTTKVGDGLPPLPPVRSLASSAPAAVSSEPMEAEAPHDLSNGLSARPSAVTQVILAPAPPVTTAASPTPSGSLVVQFSIPADFGAQADAMESQGNHSQALGLYFQALKQQPQNARLWWGLGHVYEKLGREDYAIHCYKKVLVLDPSQKTLADWVDQYEKTYATP
jgi:hypothetical protein